LVTFNVVGLALFTNPVITQLVEFAVLEVLTIVPKIASPVLILFKVEYKALPAELTHQDAIVQYFPPPASDGPYWITGWMISS